VIICAAYDFLYAFDEVQMRADEERDEAARQMPRFPPQPYRDASRAYDYLRCAL